MGRSSEQKWCVALADKIDNITVQNGASKLKFYSSRLLNHFPSIFKFLGILLITKPILESLVYEFK